MRLMPEKFLLQLKKNSGTGNKGKSFKVNESWKAYHSSVAGPGPPAQARSNPSEMLESRAHSCAHQGKEGQRRHASSIPLVRVWKTREQKLPEHVQAILFQHLRPHVQPPALGRLSSFSLGRHYARSYVQKVQSNSTIALPRPWRTL